MPYTTREDMGSRFGVRELDELLQTSDDQDAAFEAVAADSDALIDGYLGSVVLLPLVEPVPALVVSLAADITRYRLWDDRAPSEVRKRYEDAIAMLKDIARGVLKLPGAVVPPATEFGGIVSTTDRTRSFTDQTLSGFVGGCGYRPFGGGRGK